MWGPRKISNKAEICANRIRIMWTTCMYIYIYIHTHYIYIVIIN